MYYSVTVKSVIKKERSFIRKQVKYIVQNQNLKGKSKSMYINSSKGLVFIKIQLKKGCISLIRLH